MFLLCDFINNENCPVRKPVPPDQMSELLVNQFLQFRASAVQNVAF